MKACNNKTSSKNISVDVVTWAQLRQFTMDLHHQQNKSHLRLEDACMQLKFGSETSHANAVKLLVCTMRNEKEFNIVQDLSTTTIEVFVNEVSLSDGSYSSLLLRPLCYDPTVSVLILTAKSFPQASGPLFCIFGPKVKKSMIILTFGANIQRTDLCRVPCGEVLTKTSSLKRVICIVLQTCIAQYVDQYHVPQDRNYSDNKTWCNCYGNLI